MENGMIYGKIAQIMRECPAIGKNQRNQQQGYSYRGIDDVMNGLQNILPKYGVFYVPEVLESTREERTTAKGGNLIYSILKVKYTFFAEDGSHVSAIVQSEGMDSADKSSNKAMSAACKYALFQVFNIPTAEMVDPDATTPENSVKAGNQAQPKEQAKPTANPYPGDEAVLKKFELPKNFSTDVTIEEAAAIYGQKTIEELYNGLKSLITYKERNQLTKEKAADTDRRIAAIYLLFDVAKKERGF